RAGLEGDLAGIDLVRILLHQFLDPRLEIRIAEIADPPGCSLSWSEGMARVLARWGRRAGNRLEAGAARVDPASLAAGQIGRRCPLSPRVFHPGKRQDDAADDTERRHTRS